MTISTMNMINIKHQNGAVLIVSMVILVALTMLGVTSMKSSLTELTMAGNIRESGLTFQAAESGLSFAEGIIDDTKSIPTTFDDSDGFLSATALDPDYLKESVWASAPTASVKLSNIKSNPKFIIHYIGERSTNPNVDSIKLGEGYAGDQSGVTIDNFRVTSRGTGQTDGSSRVVQSYYAKEQ